jgi:hypothetical protein
MGFLEDLDMKQKFTLRRILLSGLLISSIIGLLVIYFATTSNLPSQIYSAAQLEFLSRNYIKSVYQMAPVLNTIGADGIIEAITLPWRRSYVRAYLKAQQEEFEGVSATVYDLEFHAEYKLGSPNDFVTEVEIFFPFPSNLETLHEVSFLVDDEEPLGVHYSTQGIRWQTQLFPEEEHIVTVSYFADGANTFTYALPQEQRSDVDISIAVSGLTGSTVPRTSLPPTEKEVKENDEVITWDYTNLIADRDIQITLPSQLSFSQRVAQLQDDFRALASMAPIFVGACVLSLAGVFHLRRIRIRLENYLLVGCGLALFYPLLTFLSGLLEVTLAATLTILLITALLLAFLRLTTDQKGIIWWAGIVLIVFLGIFSLGMLTPWRGMLLTGGGLILLGTFMMLYARRPVEPQPEPVSLAQETAPQPGPVLSPEKPPAISEFTPSEHDTSIEDRGYHCPYCGRELLEEFGFCPGCGRDAKQVQRCENCGNEQFLPPDLDKVYCLSCGEPLT